MRLFSLSACLLLSAFAASCATPRVEVTGRGPTPSFHGPAAYRLAPGDGRTIPGEDAIRALVQTRLEAGGFRLAPAGGKPAYMAEISFTDRPGKVGTYVRVVPSKKGEQPDWLTPPHEKPWWTLGKPGFCTLAIQLFTTNGQGEAYRVLASQKRAKAGCDQTALVEAALADIPLKSPKR